MPKLVWESVERTIRDLFLIFDQCEKLGVIGIYRNDNIVFYFGFYFGFYVWNYVGFYFYVRNYVGFYFDFYVWNYTGRFRIRLIFDYVWF